MGPAALRTAGLATLLESLDFEVVDHGDLSVAELSDLVDRPPEKANHYREIQRWTRLLSRSGYEIAKTGAVPIFLGGDHTLSMGAPSNAIRRVRCVTVRSVTAISREQRGYTSLTEIRTSLHGGGRNKFQRAELLIQGRYPPFHHGACRG